MSQVTVSFYEQSAEVTLEFLKLMRPKKKTSRTKSTDQKSKLVIDPLLRADFGGGHGQNEVEVLAAGAVLAPVQEAAQDTPHAAAVVPAEEQQQNPALLIARRLRELGDQLEDKISEDFRQKFVEELKNQSIFNLAYTSFSRMCLRSLAAVQDQVRNGWEQIYLLHYGYTEIVLEMDRQAGSAPESRLEFLANCLGDILRDLGLEHWATLHGGWGNLNPMLRGDVVQITLPPEGSSVD